MDNQIRRDNRKALGKFLVVMFISAVFGGLLGAAAVSARMQGLGQEISQALARMLPQAALWAMPVLGIILLGGATGCYLRARRDFSRWDGEEERVVDAAEMQLNWALLLVTVQIIVNFFLFAAITIGLESVRSLLGVGCFLLLLVWAIAVQQKVVDLERQMNPEKQGSVYDLNFRKKWFNSCDEAEQRQIGQAAYSSYKALNVACPVIWVVLLLGNFFLDLGLLPIFITTLIWGIASLAYLLSCIRQQSGSDQISGSEN